MDSEHQQIMIVALVALVAIVAMVVFVGRGDSSAGYSGFGGNVGGLAMDDGGGLPEGCAANGAFVRDKTGVTWHGCSTDDGTFCMTPNGNADLAKCYSPEF